MVKEDTAIVKTRYEQSLHKRLGGVVQKVGSGYSCC